jgi:hypothetical protein
MAKNVFSFLVRLTVLEKKKTGWSRFTAVLQKRFPQVGFFIADRIQLGFYAAWAHAVRGVHFELGIKIFFHRQPFVLVTDFAAPTADEEKIFEIIQAFEQAARRHVDPGPDQQEHGSPNQRAVPTGDKRFVKYQMGKVRGLGKPAETDEKGEGAGFNPEDAVPTFFSLFH